MTIPLFKVFMNQPRASEYQAQVMGSGYVGEGPVTERFEERIADLLGLPVHPAGEPRILAVNSCTMALTIALECAGVGPGDEVISTPITCTATSGAIVNRGATIVWADVDRETGNIDPADVVNKITAKTKAIVAVDWGGRLCNYKMLDLAATSTDYGFDIPIIRDAAHSFLANAEFLGDFVGDYVCYSFGPIKHLTCGGYGGALVTPPEQTKRARLLRWHGLDRRSGADFRCAQDIVEAGYRGHLTDDLAAVGLANAERIEWVVDRHRENAAWYLRAFKLPVPGITSPPADPGSAWWLFTVLADDRDGLQAYLSSRGVASSPVHAINTRHTAFARQSRGADRVPNADWFDAHQLSIPVGWWVTPEERNHIASAVLTFAHQRVAV